MSNAELAAPKQRVIGVPFKPGQSGNPAGRPKGARSVLGERFLDDLKVIWEKHGLSALQAAALEKPAEFVRVVASLLPRELDINQSVSVDVSGFLGRFRQAQALLNNLPPKVIDAE